MNLKRFSIQTGINNENIYLLQDVPRKITVERKFVDLLSLKYFVSFFCQPTLQT